MQRSQSQFCLAHRPCCALTTASQNSTSKEPFYHFLRPSAFRNLGVYIDHQLNFNLHVDNLCRTSYYHIRSLRHARNCLDVGTAREIASCIVGSRLDYCNSVLYGTSKHKLHLIQNTLARVVVGARKRDHITPVLRQLHWLPVVYRIQYKIAILTFKAITSLLTNPAICQNSSRSTSLRDSFALAFIVDLL